MVVFVAVRAWPTLVHNDGVAWLGPGGDVDTQLGSMIKTGQHPPAAAYHLRAWPLLYGTLLTTGAAVVCGLVFALARLDLHRRVRAPAAPRRRSCPRCGCWPPCRRVIYGLIGILVLAPFVGNHLIGAQPQAVGSPTSSSSTARACSWPSWCSR